MAWTESHDDIWEHHKTIRLCALLKRPDYAVVGHLTSLWHFVLRNAWRDANLKPWGEAGIERAARWDGAPGAFVKALRASGYLDGYVAHGWLERAGKLVQDRLYNETRRKDNVKRLTDGVKRRKSHATQPNPTQPYQRKEEVGGIIFTLWNERAHRLLPRVKGKTKSRRAAAAERWREYPVESYWVEVIERINKSPFCLGKNDRAWKANIDFLLRPDSATKALEGQYDAKPGEALPAAEAPKCARKCGLSNGWAKKKSKKDGALICESCFNEEEVRAEA